MDFLSNSEWEEIGEWVTQTLTDNNTGTQKADQKTAVVKSPSVSGSDPDNSGGRRKNGSAKGKINKRKSRATKKNSTMYISVDPENFRKMVQQMTGFKAGGGQVPVAPLVKPEAQRLVDRVPGNWPTLDTSAYVVGPQQQQQGVGPTYTVPLSGFAPVDGGGGAGGGGGFCFESFSFPALES